MIINSLIRHQKKTAWTLLFVFYAEMVLAASQQKEMEYSFGSGLPEIKTKRAVRNIQRQNIVNEPVNEALENVLSEAAKVNPEKTKMELKSPVKVNIGGPGQPEMQSFQSVNANNMVDLFSGDFSYNIPLLDVGGYPLGISYRSGATMDQEASWVGLGWNINPGTIMRNVRGLPDDFNGTEKITKEYNIRKNWTAGITASARPEIFGIDIPKIGLNIGAFYNNYCGIGFELGASATVNFKNLVTSKTTDPKTGDTKIDSNYVTKNTGGSLAFTLNSQQGLNIDASIMRKFGNEASKINGSAKIGASYNSRAGLKDLSVSGEMFTDKKMKENYVATVGNGNIADLSFAKSSYTPTITMPFTSLGFSLSLKGGGALFGFHPLGALRGYYSSQYISSEDKIDSLPAYGYMHFQKGNRDERALLDFNREKDIMFRDKTPHTSIPFYTYDTYSISGEGIGGSFRPYRGDVGYIRDHKLKTKSGSGGIGIDLGGGPNLAHFGGNLQFNFSSLTNERWYTSNFMEKNVRFMTADSLYEPVYFRNPAEQTTNTQEYYSKIGGDDVVRVGLAGGNMEPVATNQLKRYDKQQFKGAVTVTSPIIKDKRDKRSQVISYLNAEEAERVGLDPVIKSYPVNVFPKGTCDENYETVKRNDGINGVRKPQHISEVTVLNNDGRRYIYGIPAYNLSQKEVTFAVNAANGNVNTGLVSYSTGDNTRDNHNGKDNFFSSESTPAFAHSFLLTGVLSPDYVDVTGNGISEDDRGDAIKFNYSRMRWGVSGSSTTSFKWRVPYDSYKASYNEGLKTDKNDDKGNYVYGEKEVWYVNSIESKSMIALFILDDGYREDDISVNDENGGQAPSNYALKRLKQIKLYSKSDYYKDPSRAKPIKTVNFSYSYKLCTGSPSAFSSTGKLTLDSLWFTYNGNSRSTKSKYRFNYNSNNPTYNNRSNDRWGNYKPASDNPNSPAIPNGDYPYATQVKSKADANAGAWNLTQIKLPSGAKIIAEYESDDYAYVQNKRAMNMFQICGMGLNNDYSQARALLYDNSDKSDLKDCRYVFIKVNSTVTSKDEVYRKYLEGIEKIYFKVAVKIPGLSGSNAFEMVPFYAEPEPGEYGVANSGTIWVKLKEFGSNQSFPAIAAIQFLRMNLPGKAYPGSDVIGDNTGPAPAIKAILGMGAQFKDAIKGFNKSKRQGGVCQQFDTTRSFIRLDNPDYIKYGGGYRVKKIVIADNWTSMTGQKESYYGQEYNYTTSKEIFYDSSGVRKTKTIRISSGVATYEPNVGNEENPFRQPIEYQESVTLAPTDYFYSEYPYCESLFPSPSVGYSKVTVSSINKRNLKSFNGWEESEFYTSYDFPTITDFTTFDGECKKTGKRKYSVINSLSMKRTTISQGFKIDLNDMNGKVKSQKSYAANDSAHPVSYTINYYKTNQDNIHGTYLSNTVPVMDSANSVINPSGTVGKDIELMMDFREQSSVNTGVDVNLNAETMVFVFIPVVIPPFFPVISIDDNRFRSASAVKVIQRYGILDSVLHYEKGSLVSTQNVVYDAETGEALLSRTQNEFNDPIYNFSYPSHWAYSGLGQAYKNIDVAYSDITFRKGILENPAAQHVNMNLFESGDEIYVYTTSPNGAFPDACGTGTCWIPKNPANRIWAVNTNKNSAGGADMFVFMDAKGNPYEGENVYMRIIRSGHRNMLGKAVAGITSLADPRKTRVISSGKTEQYIEFADTTKILNTTAASFKDIWKVDNRMHSKQVLDTGIRYYNPPGYTVCRGNRIQEYSQCGTIIYDLGYDVCGVIIAGTKIPGSNAFWHSGGAYSDCMPFSSSSCVGTSSRPADGDSSNSSNSTASRPTGCELSDYPGTNHTFDTLGPLNRCGIWACCDSAAIQTSLTGTYIGFSHTINTPFTKTYYIGLAADNEFSFKVDGRMVRKTPENSSTRNFQLWNIYPVNLTAGQHIIEMQGLTRGDRVSFGAEIYNNTKQDLINATSYNDLNLIFSTKDLIGTHFQTGVFTCDSSYALYTPDGDTLHYQCIKFTDTCVSRFTQPYINPYVEGIYGNWRMDTSFVYYGARKETLITSPMDIRRAGAITGYQSFWNFADPASSDPIKARFITRNNTAAANKVWSWNSTITQYNAKGFEEENKDPLGRYTAGLYGYKKQLPVAVTNNSRFMETMFDGFEDYGYEANCTMEECTPKRHADLGDVMSKLVMNEKHTGRYSLKIVNTDSVTLKGTVIRNGEADTTYGFNTSAPSQTCNDYAVAKYEGSGFVCTSSNCPDNNLTTAYISDDGGSNIDVFHKWEGYTIPESTGDYIFQIDPDDYAYFWIYEMPNSGTGSGTLITSFTHTSGVSYRTVHLTRGKIYKIQVWVENIDGYVRMIFKWKTPPMQCAALDFDFIPAKYTYSTLAAAQDHTTPTSISKTIYSLSGAGTSGYALNRKFTLLEGKTMILGAWVKEGQDCNASSYQNNSINIYFDGALAATFKPSGNIIEGWQRYEAEFTVPLNAHNFTVSFKCSSGTAYFDDIRIHPFNANEKSFVYQSTNLRLMAELDENNYASFYEYDDEGTLTRVKKETQRGIKTIQETKSTLTKK